MLGCIGAIGLLTLSILTHQYWLLGYVLYSLPMFISVRDFRGIAWYIQSLNDKLDKQEDVEWKAAEKAFVDSIEDAEREKERQKIEQQRMLREKKFGRIIK